MHIHDSEIVTKGRGKHDLEQKQLVSLVTVNIARSQKEVNVLIYGCLQWSKFLLSWTRNSQVQPKIFIWEFKHQLNYIPYLPCWIDERKKKSILSRQKKQSRKLFWGNQCHERTEHDTHNFFKLNKPLKACLDMNWRLLFCRNLWTNSRNVLLCS